MIDEPEPESGKIFSEFINGLRDLQFTRMETLEARGTRICQTNLAVLFAAVAVATIFMAKVSATSVTPASVGFLTLGFIAVVVSTIYGMQVQAGTSEYALTNGETLDRMVGGKWKCPATEARNITARRDVETIQTLSPNNEERAKKLKAALNFQLLFTSLLTAAAVTEVIGHAI